LLPPTAGPLTAAKPRATPSPRPTITPRPPVSLAVPEPWQAALAGHLSNLETPGWTWLAVPDAEPADIRFTLQETPYPAGFRSLALAVPFTTDWEDVGLDEATRIAADGHPLARLTDWAAMPSGYKALRVDGRLPADADYPLRQSWYLLAEPSYEPAAAALSAALGDRPPVEPLVHLAAVGDVMLDRALGYAVAQGDLAYPFAGVQAYLQAADFTVANLESALGDTGAPQAKRYTFRAPPTAAQSLAGAGIDLVSLANNHALDYGPEALLQGIALLHQAGVQTVGAGGNALAARAPFVTTINGLRLAFLAYAHVPVEVSGFDTRAWQATAGTPGLAWAEPELVAADVAFARQTADLVIVILHSGYEYVEPPSPPQIAAAQAAIASGAALVLGHHAHILQGIAFAGRAAIAYGLGNFAFEIDNDPNTAILNVWLDKDGVRQIELVPVVIQFGGQPRLATEGEAGLIRRQVYSLSQALGSAAHSSP
jgi:poly-gamma-glutamate synthesis protein (capsule biosynthesis protein)